jgi:hypothetical protein
LTAYIKDYPQFRKLYRRILVLGLFFCLTIKCASAAEQEKEAYRLGSGYLLGNTGIRLGGYANTDIKGFGSLPWSFELHDLSLLVSWNTGQKLSFFSELELEDALVASEQHPLTTGNAQFLIERMYVDYLVNNQFGIRIGKILTPVGQWNLIHAQPLVWTVTRPVATKNLFSEHSTGITLRGNVPIGNQNLEYSLYGDYSSSLEPGAIEPPSFDNALGVRLRYSMTENLDLGFSYVDFALTESPNIRNHLAGLDLAWSYKRHLVNSEIVYRNSDSQNNRNAWQGYLQVVTPIVGDLYAISRYEFFDQPNQKFGQLGLLGLAYRPLPPLVFKLEYRIGKNNQDLVPDGLLTSVAVLF